MDLQMKYTKVTIGTRVYKTLMGIVEWYEPMDLDENELSIISKIVSKYPSELYMKVC